jgi:hypothetical protein
MQQRLDDQRSGNAIPHYPAGGAAGDPTNESIDGG